MQRTWTSLRLEDYLSVNLDLIRYRRKRRYHFLQRALSSTMPVSPKNDSSTILVQIVITPSYRSSLTRVGIRMRALSLLRISLSSLLSSRNHGRVMKNAVLGFIPWYLSVVEDPRGVVVDFSSKCSPVRFSSPPGIYFTLYSLHVVRPFIHLPHYGETRPFILHEHVRKKFRGTQRSADRSLARAWAA